MNEMQVDEIVSAPVDDIELEGHLAVPAGAKGIVAFAHGSGSSRHSPRNQHVAEILRDGGLGTLLIDLLTDEEEEVDLQTAEYRFDIDMLARRLVGIARWLKSEPRTEHLKVGYFGSSTGGGAALVSAAEIPELVDAVVSRGGRPDLAEGALEEVEVPTLLIVGGKDEQVIQLNRQAFERLPGPKKLEIVPGASHLFEEPGKLDVVADLARTWFRGNLGRPNRGDGGVH